MIIRGSQLHPLHLLAEVDENITVFMPPTVPDEFSLIYQNLLLAATLVQVFRLPFSSLTWAEPRILRK